MLMIDGSCQSCNKYEITSDDLKGCILPTCKSREYILSEGTCAPCADYQITSQNQVSCEQK